MNGFDYSALEKKLNNLKSAQKGIKREIHYAVIALADKFVQILEYNSPYDTGQLEDSWTWDIEYAGDRIHIKIWNTAKNKNGDLYAEWVNDGHRLVIQGQEVGWVEGQFFIELSEWEVRKLLPKWKVQTERQVAKVLEKALRG